MRRFVIEKQPNTAFPQGRALRVMQWANNGPLREAGTLRGIKSDARREHQATLLRKEMGLCKEGNSQFGNCAPAGLPNPAAKTTDLAIRLEQLRLN